MPARLDLVAIERALRELQRRFVEVNARLAVPRDPLTDEVLVNLLCGYTLVDRYLADDVDPFRAGNSTRWLDLNTTVLCGADQVSRAEFEPHRQATQRHFYEQAGAGIGAIVDWHARHADESAWALAAGTYVRILSEPQLFIEGNHRSGALIMSLILARAGLPPFVVTVDNAVRYFDPSTSIKDTRKTPYALLFKVPRIKRQFALFLRGQADPAYLLTGRPDVSAAIEAGAATPA